MKFGDKLIALRKKQGLSQEDLAAKLNVSRQSVSKWESNNTYPETDKIIQICNIFDCSMDDLINENIKDLSSMERKEKNNFNIAIDSLLEFITKSINMFVNMKFTSIIKCAIEFIIITLVLIIIGTLASNLTANIICRVVGFLSYNTINVLRNIIEGLFLIVWTILSLIILVHTFKRRYLDYYDMAVKEQTTTKENKVLKEKEKKLNVKREQIPPFIIKHEPYAFLAILSKLVLYFAKFISIFIILGLAALLFSLVIFFVVLIPLSFHSLIFVGANIGVFGGLAMSFLLILVLINFILNKKTNYHVLTITFLVALTITGVGVGIGIVGLKDIEVKDDLKEFKHATYKETINYKDTSYIYNLSSETEYIIDDTIPEGKITISTKYDDSLNKLSLTEIHNYDMLGHQLYQAPRLNFKKAYAILIKDLDNKIIRDYGNFDFEAIAVTASKDTIDNLLKNLSKIYLYNQEKTATGYKISNVSNKIEVVTDNYYCDANYSALTDSMKFNSDCSCQRESIETPVGTKIKYQCRGNSSE